MKTFIIILALFIACPVAAETWKEREIREARETRIMLRQGLQHNSSGNSAAMTEMQDQIRRQEVDARMRDAEMQRQQHQMQIQQDRQRLNDIYR